MSDIFISYAREDRTSAERLAKALEDQGWSVWWDTEIPAGKTFDEVIEQAIEPAKSIVVIWSKRSVKKQWVRTEAAEGADRGILVPVLIEDVRIPLAFRRIPAANLADWDGMNSHLAFQKLVRDIAGILGPPPVAVAEEQHQAERKRQEEAERLKTEEETKRKVEEARKRVDKDAQRKAEEEARQEEERERREQAQLEEKNRREEEKAKREATAEKKRQQFEAKARREEENTQRKRAEEEQKRQKEFEAKRQAEEEERKRVVEAKRKAGEERRQKAALEATRKAEKQEEDQALAQAEIETAGRRKQVKSEVQRNDFAAKLDQTTTTKPEHVETGGSREGVTESSPKQLKIMISSTRDDLDQYREEASQVIQEVAKKRAKSVLLDEVSMERESQSGNRESPVAVSKRWVEESEWVVVIVGWNYGTIPDEREAGSLSITQIEYEYACRQNKKTFVFIAGDRGITDRYRASEEEIEDLKDWRDERLQTNKQKEKLETFKRDLQQSYYVEIFCNLKDFRKKLELTLMRAIDDLLLSSIKSGTPLAELVVAASPYIKNCIRGVKSVANCKALHDHLHDLCQYVIRPLQEEVLPSWKQDEILSEELIKKISGRQVKASRSLGKIEIAIESIGPEHADLRTSIDGLLQLPKFWDSKKDSAGSHPEWEVFDEKISIEFAGEVQEAFSEAGRSIDEERENLREAYRDMQAELKKAQKLIQLDEEEQDQLKEKLSRVEANRLRMKKSLTLHKKWQESHDKLAEVEGFREHHFDSKLESYCGSPLTKLYKLLQDEIDTADSDSTGDLVNDFRHLKASIRVLRRGVGKEAFDNMRKRFDDAFFSVDKRTKDEVDEAKKRAESLEKWLDELLSRRRETETNGHDG